MIDFRYHLVSLMAVLVALTIGVILGAGPLQGPLSDSLTGQVNKLTERQAELTEQNETLKNQVSQGEKFIDSSSALTVDGTLRDVPVAVVRTSDASDAAVQDVVTLLGEAGAKVQGQAKLETAWFADDSSSARTSLAKQLTGHLGDAVNAQSSTAEVLAQGLLTSLTTADDNTQPVRDLLSGGDTKFVTFSGNGGAQALVLVTGTNSDMGMATGADKDKDMELATAQVIGKAAGSGVVLGDATVDKDFVAQVRHGSVSVTTVDSIATARGRTSVPLALAAARSGKSAAFGTGIGATKDVPEVSRS
ncbi:MAG: copper transporter [Actinomycetaceae bacterium]|nr:copper transporter [Actinomycetaceae bacterium]MDU0969619.1 copper transporter [Actinomycetaceae bacterium]